MMRHSRILAGTALGLLMASPPVGAVTMPQAPAAPAITAGLEATAEAPLLLVQGEGNQELTKEELRRLRKERREAERAGGAEQEEQAPAEAEQAAPAQEEESPRKKRREREAEQVQQQQEAQPEQAAPAQEEETPRKKRREREAEQVQEQQEQQEQQETQPEQAAPVQEEETPRNKRRERQAEQRQEQQEAQPEQAAPAQEEEAPRPRRQRERQAEQPQQQQEAQPEQAEPEQAAPAQEEETPRPRRQRERQRVQEAAPETPVPSERPAGTTEQAPQDMEAAPAEPEAAPRAAEPRTRKEQRRAGTREAPPGKEAPLFDSQKEAPAAAAAPEGGEAAQPSREQRREERRQRRERREAQPLPENDRAAQQDVQPREIVPVTREEGRRRERAPERLERPEGAEVLRQIGERVILELGGGRPFVESDDRPRIRRDARDVYYEDLPRGRVRETIVRPNGTQVVTIRNRYGDIVRRSRIAPDGREYVLVYADEDNWDRGREWRDPGLDLPPLEIDIPRDEYILDAGRVEDPDVYYDFLEQPPVERVERLYTVDEVKRSARVRDIARRIDLDTINFDFGSDKIAEDQISHLEGVAVAMERMLEKNPAETFLIEGHTDAVGSDLANLALSDRRAEAVAEALTNVFGIPPENLVTQGYGEQYLKVRTESPERENRRVAMRRITPLVAPVASAK